MPDSKNLLTVTPGTPGVETCTTLLRHPAFTLEHLASRGAASPAGCWYDQPRAEWVLLLHGTADLQYATGETRTLSAGDSLIIPAHCRHRVTRTSPDALWLALHYHQDLQE